MQIKVYGLVAFYNTCRSFNAVEKNCIFICFNLLNLEKLYFCCPCQETNHLY